MDYKDLIVFFKKKTNIDLALYKEQQMRRRIETFIQQEVGSLSYSEFISRLGKDEDLLDRFKDRMTINVTEFYRNPQVWESLKDKVIPKLVAGKRKINIWSAGCSTGEEPYSLAILMKENFPHIEFNITATDLDEIVLDRSKRGVYSEVQLKSINKTVRSKYFIDADVSQVKKSDGFMQSERVLTVIDEIKKNITFKQHNLLADPFPEKMDLILCRNVVIYFTEEAKAELYKRFSKALRVGGIMVIGNTEHIVDYKSIGFEKYIDWSFERIK